MSNRGYINQTSRYDAGATIMGAPQQLALLLAPTANLGRQQWFPIGIFRVHACLRPDPNPVQPGSTLSKWSAFLRESPSICGGTIDGNMQKWWI